MSGAIDVGDDDFFPARALCFSKHFALSSRLHEQELEICGAFVATLRNVLPPGPM
jgi:hypothetical protein